MGGDDSQKLLPWGGIHSSPGRSYFRFSGVPLYLKDGRAFRGLDLSFPHRVLRLWLPECFSLKPVRSYLRAGLTGMSTSIAGSTARRYRGIAAWPTRVPPKW